MVHIGGKIPEKIINLQISLSILRQQLFVWHAKEFKACTRPLKSAQPHLINYLYFTDPINFPICIEVEEFIEDEVKLDSLIAVFRLSYQQIIC